MIVVVGWMQIVLVGCVKGGGEGGMSIYRADCVGLGAC